MSAVVSDKEIDILPGQYVVRLDTLMSVPTVNHYWVELLIH